MAIDEASIGRPWEPTPPSMPEERYPVNADFQPAGSRNRLWAFPILGGVIKLIILIPHFIVLTLLGILYAPTININWNTSGAFGIGPGFGGNYGAGQTSITFAGLAFLILWFPVLFTARMPTWGYGLVGGFLRWSTRVAAYVLGLTDKYPVFTMHSAEFPVNIRIQVPESNKRWWAFPVLGFYIKQLILIPHFLCLIGLGVAAVVLWLVMWIPVLIAGRYPRGPYGFLCGVAQWALRVQAFQAGLTDRYPPFRLS